MRLWLLIAALLAAIPAYAADPAATPAPTVLHLTQSAERRLTRDLLHVDLRAEAKGADAKTVQATINRTMTKALVEARQVAGIEVATDSYTVHRETPQNTPPDWTGSQSLLLSGTDSAALLTLAGTLQGEGLAMSNLTYEVSPATIRGAESALTAEALSGLEQRAAAIAQQLRISVLGYRDLTIGNAETGGMPMLRFAPSAAALMPAPVAAAGEATVRVTVNADILLGAKHP
ncbi:MAG TPA: SIMPL domain-containing protein [Stellaceae bacterium]|jgi:predicted secreted protein|nr:SIMPL domain-containing protein [Stellaceae bacterium]